MLRIKPFRALRPPVDLAPQIASVPYDVVSRAEAAALAEGNPNSFLHIIRPDIDLPPETPHDADIIFEAARIAFERFQKDGLLVRESEPRLYLYRQEAELLGRRRSQTGIVACCHIDDYAGNRIKKHEKTRKDKEDERTRHVLELNANAEPIFLMFRERLDLVGLMTRDSSGDPLYDFTAPDGVRHTIWSIEDAAPYITAFKEVPCAYVADGHHRTASAARAGAEHRARNPHHSGDEEYNWFLSVLFPACDLTILPYHRIVADLNGLSPEQFLEKLRTVVTLSPTDDPNPPAPGSFGVYVAGAWRRAAFDPGTINPEDPIGSLDSVLLAERILTPILGIGDIRTDKRIDFVGGIRGPAELKRRVDSGSAAVAFCMHPTTIRQLMAISDADEIMPPKSTWFEPKLRSGLLIHTLDEA